MMACIGCRTKTRVSGLMCLQQHMHIRLQKQLILSYNRGFSYNRGMTSAIEYVHSLCKAFSSTELVLYKDTRSTSRSRLAASSSHAR